MHLKRGISATEKASKPPRSYNWIGPRNQATIQ